MTSNLNNKKTGSYTIKYTIEISGKQKTITRNINVLSKKHTFNYNNQLTNKNVTITFQSHIPNFSYIMDPSNKTYKQSNITYTALNNGTYKFIVYDTENSYEEYQINIKNIDKTAPTISSCNGTISNNKTLFEITGQSSDTAKFVINNIEFTKNTQIINSSLENATVDVYDKAGNKKSYICNSIYNPINPVGTENVIKKGVTDTLRVWIEKKNRSSRTSYYVTHIWAKNPYSQFKMQVPNNFGKELITANNLLLNATNQNGYSNKLIIAVNASGFIKNGTFGQTFYDANKEWDLTGRSPLVIVNGKKLRDISNSKIPITLPVFGLKSNGLLAYYNYKAGTNLEYNINLSKKIINEGVKSTFSFGPVLVYDSTKKNNGTDQNIRQGMCQIDKNNFVFISDEYSTPRTGFSYSELADYMLSLGCKIGFNLDGGGSVSLVYKPRQSNPTIITGSTREIADIIYFHE